MDRRNMLALAGAMAAMLAASPALARDEHHGAGVSWSGMHGGVSWDGGHAYSGETYGGYTYVPPPPYRAPSYAPPSYPNPSSTAPYDRPDYRVDGPHHDSPVSLDSSDAHRDYGHDAQIHGSGHRGGH
ncbi:hypothetical protein [Mesorhizobium sp.]|jgi:hypothetical protein|uniref:hypothetical protein n=1 Tax=Mesorhizobium sp. TaxID=1871066 RepID=UPI0025D7C7FC|nr:hypothetical protein [Mesorhizobium sp.]